MAERKQAEKTSFVFGRENKSTGSPITDRKEMVKRRYVVTAWNHDENSEKQQSDALRAGRADVFGEDGFLWGDGNIEIEIPSESGFLDIIQGVLADPNPVSVPIPEKTLVADGTNLSDIVVDGYFTSDTDLTVAIVDGQNLSDRAVTIVNAENLSGTGDKTVDDDLSGYGEALTLTITPSGSPALTNTGTPGTVVITYTDAGGRTRTTTRSFANNALTTPQTTNLPVGATITRVRTTGFNTGTFNITTDVTDKTVANDLRGLSSDVEEAVTVTVTPDSAAALAVPSTDGIIAIEYLDADGEPQTSSLTFPDASKTVAQQTNLPVGAVVKRIAAAGWNAGTFDITTAIDGNIVRNPERDRPGQLRVRYTGSLTNHKVRIRGVRRVGLASNDTLPMREEIDLDTSVLTKKYFHKIHKVEVRDTDGRIVNAPTGTIEILSEPGGYETTLKTVNDDPTKWTMEPEVGGEPWLITGGVPIGADIEIGENIKATIDILSNRVDKRRTIEGGDDEQFIGTAAQHPSEFPFVGRRFFPAYGRYLEIDGEAVICDAAPISIAHNHDFAQGKKPGRFRRGTEPTARRNVTSNIQTKYESGTSEEDVFIRWDEKFRNNESVYVKIVTYQWLGNGRQLAIIYEMVNCEITSPVRVAATSPGGMPITVAVKAVPPDGETDGELRVKIIGDDRWR